MKRSGNKKTLRKLPIIIGLAVVLVLGGGAFAYSQLSSDPVATNNKTGIDFSPATEAEKQDSEQHKEETANKDRSGQEQSPTASSVTPIIVDASQYGDKIEVRAYVPGIYEDGGTCTVTFSKNSLEFTKQTTAAKDATTTGCTSVSINRSEFQEAGQWSVTVRYSSSAAQGISQTKTLEVK